MNYNYDYIKYQIEKIVKMSDLKEYPEGVVLYPFGKQGVLIK